MTGEDKMPYGKYKGQQLDKIPPIYFTTFSPDAVMRDKYPQLIQWIEDNCERLYMEAGRPIPVKKAMKIIKATESIVPCFKYCYASEEQAKKHLKEIRRKVDNPNRTIPVRAYQCPNCRGWHLTSKP